MRSAPGSKLFLPSFPAYLTLVHNTLSQPDRISLFAGHIFCYFRRSAGSVLPSCYWQMGRLLGGIFETFVCLRSLVFLFATFVKEDPGVLRDRLINWTP
jgi:hypothetical protein